MSPRRVALAAAALLVGLLAPAGAASAARAAAPMHAELVSTTPTDGATVETAAQVTMTFSEDVNPKFLEVRVEGPDGQEADGPPVATAGVVTQDLVADLPAGTHTVTYRVVSVDGHPVSGTFSFTTTAGPAATATRTQETTSPAPSTSAPVVVSPGPPASPVPTSTSSEGVPGWLVPLVLAIIAVLVIVPALLLARRTRPPSDEDEPEAP